MLVGGASRAVIAPLTGVGVGIGRALRAVVSLRTLLTVPTLRVIPVSASWAYPAGFQHIIPDTTVVDGHVAQVTYLGVVTSLWAVMGEVAEWGVVTCASLTVITRGTDRPLTCDGWAVPPSSTHLWDGSPIRTLITFVTRDTIHI